MSRFTLKELENLPPSELAICILIERKNKLSYMNPMTKAIAKAILWIEQAEQVEKEGPPDPLEI